MLKGNKVNVDELLFVEGLKIYNDDQLKEIKEGIEEGVDVDLYSEPEFDSNQMGVIREALETGLDVSSFADYNISVDDMRKVYRGMLRDMWVSVAL